MQECCPQTSSCGLLSHTSLLSCHLPAPSYLFLTLVSSLPSLYSLHLTSSPYPPRQTHYRLYSAFSNFHPLGLSPTPPCSPAIYLCRIGSRTTYITSKLKGRTRLPARSPGVEGVDCHGILISVTSSSLMAQTSVPGAPRPLLRREFVLVPICLIMSNVSCSYP